MNAPKYSSPLDPEVANAVARLDADAREFFEERAGIKEHDGGLPRKEAERQALAETVTYLERRDR